MRFREVERNMEKEKLIIMKKEKEDEYKKDQTRNKYYL